MKSFEPSVQHNKEIPSKLPIFPGPTPTKSKFKSHSVGVVYENNMYPIILFRKKVCHEFKDDSTDIKFGPLCLCIKEKVKFDRKLFGKMKVIKHRPKLYSKDGKLYMEKHRCLFGNGCSKCPLSRRDLKVRFI
ncbi:hypothetical protein RF11_01549 [Thelohanellus kitauei]|uniref:Uncharacterized protein n=1 Tax=Thelohanellus kitauei TaxID=669202 RepID=A0A0C2IUA3_THEKT|nr:hypothetical protein RF11_01549 [Thelohanellus kitauei]